MSGFQIVSFSGFAGGEYGLLGGRHVPADSFTAKNMVRLVDGSMCVRGGLVDLAPTGVPNGVLRGIGWTQAATNGTPIHLWFVVGTGVYAFNGEATGSAVTSYTGALASSAAYPIAAADVVNSSATRLTYISVPGDKTYKLNHSAHTVTAITASAGGRALCFYRDRLVGIDATQGNRIRFSAAGDYDTAWPAANYFDVGDGWAISALIARRNGIYISTINGSWWFVQGTLGVNEVLRCVRPSDNPVHVPHEWTHATPAGDGRMWFVPTYKDYPSSFDGANTTPLKYLSFGSGTTTQDALPSSAKVMPGQFDDEALIVSGLSSGAADNRAALRKNNVWTFHTFGTDVTSWAAAGPTGRFVLAADGTAGTPAAFYVWDTNLERPPVAGDPFARTGDLSDTGLDASLTLPEWWAPQGFEVQIQRVWVDFKKWNTGGSSTNHFDLTVDALGRFNLDGAGSSTTLSWDEAVGSATTDGLNDREALGFGNQGPAGGFQLRFTNVRGIAIRSVHVECRIVETTPRAA